MGARHARRARRTDARTRSARIRSVDRVGLRMCEGRCREEVVDYPNRLYISPQARSGICSQQASPSRGRSYQEQPPRRCGAPTPHAKL